MQVLAPIKNSRSAAAGPPRERRKMARPKKEKGLTRARHVTVRFSETQYDILSESAAQAGLTLSEYIRTQLMKGKVVAKYEIVADVPELKKLSAEFGKIGGNLNQIARHFNQGDIHSQEMRRSISQCITEIYEMKYEVAKMAGDFYGNSKTHSR